MGLSTHILDTTRGKPAADVIVTLFQKTDRDFVVLHKAHTNQDGRISSLLPEGMSLSSGIYRLHFDVASYFSTLGTKAFYPSVSIDFVVENPSEHFHVPLLLQPYGYATYRGS